MPAPSSAELRKVRRMAGQAVVMPAAQRRMTTVMNADMAVPAAASKRRISRVRASGRQERPRNRLASATGSVADTTAPSRAPVGQSTPAKRTTSRATTAAVMSGPVRARMRLGVRTRSTASQRVWMPEEKRMPISATVPSSRASATSRKRMCPGPSAPASMPAAMNRTSEEIPRFGASRVARMPKSSRQPSSSSR